MYIVCNPENNAVLGAAKRQVQNGQVRTYNNTDICKSKINLIIKLNLLTKASVMMKSKYKIVTQFNVICSKSTCCTFWYLLVIF